MRTYPLSPIFTSATISRSATGKWYVSFSSEVEAKRLAPNKQAVGIDVGLNSFATLSRGGYRLLVSSLRSIKRGGIRLKTYILKVKLQQDEDGRWSAWIPSLKGCAAWGHTEQEAIQAIRDAAEIYIEDMLEAGGNLKLEAGGVEVKEEIAVAVTV